VLNTTLWDLGSQLTSVDDEFAAWVPVMFAPPPPPPPSPCATQLPCVQADATGNAHYLLVSNLSTLCAGATTAAQVNYTGERW
jgi:hypothetical protein